MRRFCYPTQASGHDTGTLRQRGHKAVTVRGGYVADFAIRVQILISITRVAVQFILEPENCHGAGL